VVYEFAALHAPFEATNQIQLALKIKAGKFERIPSQYSDDLFKMIKWMMSIEQSQRPNVEDLMQHPRISKFIKELQFKDIWASAKRKEAELLKREADLKAREDDQLRELKEI
jgi:NIMA (never in mitosis gene a)-related kinase 2